MLRASRNFDSSQRRAEYLFIEFKCVICLINSEVYAITALCTTDIKLKRRITVSHTQISRFHSVGIQFESVVAARRR